MGQLLAPSVRCKVSNGSNELAKPCGLYNVASGKHGFGYNFDAMACEDVKTMLK